MGRRKKPVAKHELQISSGVAEDPRIREQIDEIKVQLLDILLSAFKDKKKIAEVKKMSLKELLNLAGRFESQTKKITGTNIIIPPPMAPPAPRDVTPVDAGASPEALRTGRQAIGKYLDNEDRGAHKKSE